VRGYGEQLLERFDGRGPVRAIDVSGFTFRKGSTVIDKVLTILSASSSTAQLRAISEAYQRRYQQTLAQCISKEFSGHMKAALLYMVYRATDPAKVSAMQFHRAIPSHRDHEANSITIA